MDKLWINYCGYELHVTTPENKKIYIKRLFDEIEVYIEVIYIFIYICNLCNSVIYLISLEKKVTRFTTVTTFFAFFEKTRHKVTTVTSEFVSEISKKSPLRGRTHVTAYA